MKDIILKPGSFSTVVKTSHSSNTPGQSLEDYLVNFLKSPACCTKILKETTVVLQSYTTAAIAALTGMEEGTIVYDSTTNKLNFYNGTDWEVVTSAVPE
jgi:hypothetical protein